MSTVGATTEKIRPNTASGTNGSSPDGLPHGLPLRGPLRHAHLKPPRQPPHPALEALEEQLMRVCGRAMERAPWRVCRQTGAWLGLVFFYGARRRRDIAVSNVRLAFPAMSEATARQIARRSAQNFAMTFCEFLHLRTASPCEVRAYADINGMEHIQAAFAQGRGVLLLTAHLGNWEVMGARAAQDFPLTVVARPSSNAGIQHHIAEVRRAAGIDVISKFDTGRASVQVLRANGALGILPDQYAWPDGPLMPMFGHLTRFVTSPARLALLARAPIVPGFGVRRRPWLADGRIVATVWPSFYLAPARCHEAREAAVLDGTRCVIAQIEKIVRRHPDQWLWMHRRWRAEDIAANPEAPHGD